VSDNYQTLVFLDPVERKDTPLDGHAALRLLTERGVIGGEARVWTRGRVTGHAPGPLAREYVLHPPRGWPATPGREPVVELSYQGRFHGDINQPADGTCPRCGGTTRNLEWHEPPLLEVLERIDRQTVVSVACAQCGAASDVREWKFDPPAAFGDVGVDFENWPDLSERLIHELEGATGRRVRRVRWSV
jgi:hypothetical protein